MKPHWNIATFFSRLFRNGWLALLAVSSSACSHLYFYPMKEIVATPDQAGLQYEVVQVTTRDHLKLHNWLLKAENPRGLILFLHGNAENISTHIGNVYWLPAQGFDVLLLDYRGYGLSEGDAGFPGVFLDTEATYAWARQYATERHLPLFILGQSLGAAIASYYFSSLPPAEQQFEAMALDAVFSGYADIARDVTGRSLMTAPFRFVIGHLVPQQYDPKDHIAGLANKPVLFFHSIDDPIIPWSQGRRVFEMAHSPKTWVTTQGPHTATFNDPENRARLLEFFNAANALNPSAHPQKD